MMQFRDLKKQYEVLKPQMDAAIAQVLNSSQYINGPQVQELEARLAAYVGRKHCISCSDGTAALQLALMAWGIGPGDAVFVPDFTFFSTGEVASAIGATPVFYDVCPDSFNADAGSLELAIEMVKKEGKLRPAAVAAVDLFGLSADYDAILAVADKYGLPVLEDAAQGFGGVYKGGRCCSFGKTSITSFYPSKPVGCYGDGGAVFTDDDEQAVILRSLGVHGKGSFKYDNVRIGMNSRLDSLQAAVLLVKMDAFEQYELRDVNTAAGWYNEAVADLPLELPVIPGDCLSSWAQYTVKLPEGTDRSALQGAMKERGIPTMVFYPKPMHVQKAFGPDSSPIPCPETEKLCARVLSLPLHPYMERAQVEAVAAALRECL